MKSSALVILVLIVLGGALFYFFGTPAPVVSLEPKGGPVSAAREITINLDVNRAALKNVSVSAVQGGKQVEVFAKAFAPGSHQARETFNLGRAGLKDGPFQLQVTADDSPMRFGAGKSAKQVYQFTFESTPPVVDVLSTAHNIAQGGSALVVYTLSKEVQNSGIEAGQQFYPGYRQSGNLYACLFPFPYDQDPNLYVPRVTAVDRAGNEGSAGIYYHLIPKRFPSDTIELSDPFLEKIYAEFRNSFPQAKTPLEVFLKANVDLRAKDAKILKDLSRDTSPVPLWQGAFLRLPNSAARGEFAQVRTYVYKGKKVDQETHLGIDLASLAHAPVPAANSGRVVHASDLGIYGQCVIIDHGLGLQTLYGHLSRIGVKVGDKVEKGQIIGNTGATGMAGGDHLHFGVVVSGIQVNPIEWWDPAWIRNNVTGKLEAGRVSAAGEKAK